MKTKEFTPGPCLSENKWLNWEPKFRNYLYKILGMNRTPLSYVIRENDAPNSMADYFNFNEQFVACVPLTDAYYEAGSSTVHQSIISFTTGHPSEDWIKPVEKHKDSPKSMKALRDHFSGEGNTTRRMAVAERMKKQLNYTYEKALTFEDFLIKCQKMYNIYQTGSEEMTEEAKLRYFFKKIDHEGLSKTVEAMKTNIATEAVEAVTYTTVANHISTTVSELPDY